jgi:hypothetical protein
MVAKESERGREREREKRGQGLNIPFKDKRAMAQDLH